MSPWDTGGSSSRRWHLLTCMSALGLEESLAAISFASDTSLDRSVVFWVSLVWTEGETRRNARRIGSGGKQFIVEQCWYGTLGCGMVVWLWKEERRWAISILYGTQGAFEVSWCLFFSGRVLHSVQVLVPRASLRQRDPFLLPGDSISSSL